MNTKLLKKMISEIITELDAGMGGSDINLAKKILHDTEHEHRQKQRFQTLSSTSSKAEFGILKKIAKMAYNEQVGTRSFEELVLEIASDLGIDAGDWPDMGGQVAGIPPGWKEITFDPEEGAGYICSVLTIGSDGYVIDLGPGKPEACPAHWGVKAKPLGSPDVGGEAGREGRDFRKTLTSEEKQVWIALEKLYDDGKVGAGIPFDRAIAMAASEAGVDMNRVTFDLKKAERLAKKLFLAESKKRGFGEGRPPGDEMYKKRQVVQEADLEAPDAAAGWGETAGEQGEAGTDLSDAQAQAGEAAGERKEAAEAWKEAAKLKIDAVDAAQAHAEKEGEATKAAEEANKAASDAAAEKEKAIDIAKKAYEQEQEAADAVQAASEKESAAMDALSKGQKELSDKTKEFGDKAPEFGDALSADQEASTEKEEEREKEREEQEAEAEEKDEEREEADKEAAAGAGAEEESAEEGEEEPVEESFINKLKSLIREEHYRLHEKKWGQGGKDKSNKKSVEKELPKTGLTANDLRGMVLQVVMKGAEERDNQMIGLLKDMLDSLRSIEYETTPEKGVMSQMARKASVGWVKEGMVGKAGKVRNQFLRMRGVIKEMRAIGASQEADLYEGLLSWLSTRGEDEGEAVQREIEGEIADTQELMARLRGAIEEKYGSADIELSKTPIDPARGRAQVELSRLKKQIAEVPGHHN